MKTCDGCYCNDCPVNSECDNCGLWDKMNGECFNSEAWCNLKDTYIKQESEE
jgi:hypothetical protein